MRGALLAAALAIAGCGDNTLPYSRYFDAELEARCEHGVTCGEFANVNTCREFFVPILDVSLEAGVASGSIHYDDASAVACLSAVSAESCDRTARDVRVPDESCARVFTGDLAIGSSCGVDAECASLRCVPAPPGSCGGNGEDGTCCLGTCGTPRHQVGLDDPCMTDDDCAIGAFCSGSACAPLLESGTACDADAHCDFGLACLNLTFTQSGTCGALPTLGKPCPYGTCDELGSVCNADELCAAVALPGGACATTSDCGLGESCGSDSICAAFPILGAPCVTGCASDAFCGSDHTCDALLDNGQPCAADNECSSKYCLEGPIFDECEPAPVCL